MKYMYLLLNLTLQWRRNTFTYYYLEKNICSINHWSFLYHMQTSYNNVNVIVFIGRLKC